MATPTSTPTPPALAHIEPSTAAAPPRKLPIKRKKTPQPPSLGAQPSLTSTDPLLASSTSGLPTLATPDHALDDEDEDDDYGTGEDDESPAAPAPIDVNSAAAATAVAPPFRFQRVWSESDEIRFLQGLLGCWSQGLVFPRDLNIFFDRFSEPMPQPYTRSQLSEKLRRLRKKYRVTSARVARGQDPTRLAPHDRDVFHLCTRLWDPSYAASSPFSSSEGMVTGGSGNKRRRPNPRTPSARARAESTPSPLSVLPPPPALLPPLPPDEKVGCAMDGTAVNELRVGLEKEVKQEMPLPEIEGDKAAVKDAPKHPLGKTILDVFDSCLKELKAAVAIPGSSTSSATEKNSLENKWRELRISELDVVARRLRLILENALQN
ncbi:hypothetical protein Cni_G11303 [Canna indica]|uniref:Glabrous enhancer-binding protein-like DBD domain-containing protein n=1 Tax=Canna indica TaxID=4628 RepID=A0AAQ3K7I2_9LILI|nr:hypothetical protein Cni_G11303 [Canna indica]